MNLFSINAELDKSLVIEALNESPIESLWDSILRLQVEIYADKEIAYIHKKIPSWYAINSVIDVGCGNAAYAAYLANKFPEKIFHGIDANPQLLKIADESYNLPNITFSHADASRLAEEVTGRFDAAIFRFVVQHLTDPCAVLSGIHASLQPGGRIIIIDSADDLFSSSMNSVYLDSLFESIKSAPHKIKNDRHASFNVMTDISNKNSQISKLFEVEVSNINLEAKAVANEQFILKTRQEKELIFAQKIIFFQIWKQQYGLEVNLSRVYDEYKAFVLDEAAFLCDGSHILILKKI